MSITRNTGVTRVARKARPRKGALARAKSKVSFLYQEVTRDFGFDLSSKLLDTMPAGTFEYDYYRGELLRKHPSLQDGVSPEERQRRAVMRLVEADDNCWRINREGLPGFNSEPRRMHRIFHYASRIFANLVSNCDQWPEFCTFTNGAALGLPRSKSHPARKAVSSRRVTPRALRYAEAYFDGTPTEAYRLDLALGSRCDTVPKNNEIDRAICIEPSINMMLQRGVGLCLRRSLRSVGIDLRSQTANQELAKLGSITGKFATLDLSAASDSVSIELIRKLSPSWFFDLLLDLRSPRMVLPDGSVREIGMISSMGNGFTFELETCVFYSLVKAALIEGGSTDTTAVVYGDDIICPTDEVERVIWILEACGFTVNKEKSFYSRTYLFRESCGAYYKDGIDVKPVYIREPLNNVQACIKYANQIYKLALRNSSVPDPNFLGPWMLLVKYIPKQLHGHWDPDTLEGLCSSDKGTHIIQSVAEPESLPELGRYFIAHQQGVIGEVRGTRLEFVSVIRRRSRFYSRIYGFFERPLFSSDGVIAYDMNIDGA